MGVVAEPVRSPVVRAPSGASGVSGAVEVLSRRRVYFGHQSVGYGVLAGAEAILREHGGVMPRIVESGDPKDLAQPGLVHSKIGSNADARSKLQAFANYLAAGGGDLADIACFKLCYVDVDHRTDPAALFDDYARAFEGFASRYPRVRLAHVTVPLTSRPTGWKNAVKRAIGKPLWGDEHNRNRHAFNEKLRALAGGRLFDLARLEATREDGSACAFTLDGRAFPCLDPALTSDGGHLNERGRRVVGGAFLEFLASLGEGRA